MEKRISYVYKINYYKHSKQPLIKNYKNHVKSSSTTNSKASCDGTLEQINEAKFVTV
jgi:hypothetical protein